MLLTPAFRPALRAIVGSRLPTAVRAGVAFALVYLLPACRLVDAVPTAPPVATDHQGWAADVTNVASTNGVNGGTAELGVEGSATIRLTGDTDWTLEKTGALTGTTVTWNITATEVATVSGQLVVEGTLVLTNLGDGPAPLGNVVVNLQTRVGSQWVTRSSNVATATDGDAATTAAIHAKASSENLGSFTENNASGALTFADALTDAPVSLVPALVVASGGTREISYTATFDNTDALLHLAPGTPVRAEVIVTFGNATVNGNSTANVDINGNGVIDQDEARVRSVAERVGVTVPATPNGTTPVLSDALDDITTSGTVTFSDALFTLGATSGTVTATVDGGADGGTIANCAHLRNNDRSIDLQDCSTVDVAATPPTCTPGAPGCGWDVGYMRTFTQDGWGTGSTSGGEILVANFTGLYGIALVIGGNFTATFSSASAVFSYLPASGPAGNLTGDVQNPLTTSAGELGGEVLALKLNTDMSSILGNEVSLGSLRFCNFTDLPSLNGQTVLQFLDAANTLLGGGSAPYSASVAAAVARRVNNAFVDGVPSTFAQASLVTGACPGSPPPCTPGAPGCGWQTGDVFTRTQFAWDITSAWYGAYDVIYAPTGGIVEVGIPGSAGFSLRFTAPDNVSNFFIQTGTPGALDADAIDTSASASGQFGGGVLALRMNIDFSAAGALGGTVPLGGLSLCNMTEASLNGVTVSGLLSIANTLLGGGTNGYTIGAINTIVTELNVAFLDGAPSVFAEAHLVNGVCP